jgi:transcriptional regulator with XRE-family HTH domain
MPLRPNPERVLDDVGRRVAELRKQREWTQEQLAERMGFSVQHLKQVEAGKYNLTLRSLALFAQILRSPLVELLRPPKSRAKRKPGRPRKDG